jgi:hypothetical protein
MFYGLSGSLPIDKEEVAKYNRLEGPGHGQLARAAAQHINCGDLMPGTLSNNIFAWCVFFTVEIVYMFSVGVPHIVLIGTYDYVASCSCRSLYSQYANDVYKYHSRDNEEKKKRLSL